MSRHRLPQPGARPLLCLWLCCLHCVGGSEPETSSPQAMAAKAPVPGTSDANEGNVSVAKSEPSKHLVYSFAGKRDPFRSYLVDLHQQQRASREGRAEEPTEAFDTAQFRLTAILRADEPSAMVEDPSGRGHIVRLGSRIGKNNGRIKRIDADGVQVVEQLFDGTGQLMEVPTVLRLPSETETTTAP